MNRELNIGNHKSALEVLHYIKDNYFSSQDLRITNSHITDINKLAGRKIFHKDVLYISSKTIWELMQDRPGHGSHNYHSLSPEDLLLAFQSLKRPKVIFEAKAKRYAIITIELSHFNEPFMVIIEIGAPIYGKINANVYKIVTIYPKSNSDKYIENLDKKTIVYKYKK